MKRKTLSLTLALCLVFACLSGCAGQTEKREIDYTFTKNNAASFIDDYLAEEYPAIGSLVEKVNTAQITESNENGMLGLRAFKIDVHSRFYPFSSLSAPKQLTSFSGYKMYAGKIDYIKVLNDETVCLTTKIEDEQSEFPALMNVIYKRRIKRYEDINYESWRIPDRKDTENTEYSHYILESYVTTVKLSKKDYEKIRVGDPAKKVYDIDSAVLLDLLSSRSFVYDDFKEYISFRVLSEGILAIRFKQVDDPVSDTGTVLDNLEVYKMDFIKFQDEMPAYYLYTFTSGFFYYGENSSLNELYVDFSINSADQVEFFEYK